MLNTLIVKKSTDQTFIEKYGTDRYVEGYATVNVVDSQNHRVDTKSIDNYLNIWMRRGGILMFEHTHYHAGNAISWKHELYKDKDYPDGVDAIFIKGYIFSDYEPDHAIWAGIENKEIRAFSIAFVNQSKSIECDAKKCNTVFHKAGVFEITLTKKPVHKKALITKKGNIMKKSEKNEDKKETEKNKDKEETEKESVTPGNTVEQSEEKEDSDKKKVKDSDVETEKKGKTDCGCKDIGEHEHAAIDIDQNYFIQLGEAVNSLTEAFIDLKERLVKQDEILVKAIEMFSKYEVKEILEENVEIKSETVEEKPTITATTPKPPFIRVTNRIIKSKPTMKTKSWQDIENESKLARFGPKINIKQTN